MTDQPNANGKPSMRKGLIGGVAGIAVSVPILTFVADKIMGRIDRVEQRVSQEIDEVEPRLTAAIKEGDNIRDRLNAYVEAGILQNPHTDPPGDC
ncbi:MAG: hypothetical protein O7D91_21575 [Planctomycetota bacterium]|nr:hypothetical protein [Planctomycetota bacterium]